MTLQQLVCFRATARHGSFNAAARVLGLSQPAVSDQVRRLERELGTTLVRRDGRGLALTDDGRVFLAHAERVADAAGDAVASVGRGAHEARPAIALGLNRNAPYYPVEELVADFAAAHPDIRLRLPGDNSARVAEAVRSGELEAAVVILPVDPRGLDVRPLFRDEVLVVSAEAARVWRPVTIEQLAGRPLVLYDASSGFEDPTRRQLASRAQQAGVALEPRYDVEHVETAAQLAVRGLGDTIAAASVTRRPWFPAELHRVAFAEPLYDHFTLVTRAGPAASGAMRALLEVVETWAERMRARLEGP